MPKMFRYDSNFAGDECLELFQVSVRALQQSRKVLLQIAKVIDDTKVRESAKVTAAGIEIVLASVGQTKTKTSPRREPLGRTTAQARILKEIEEDA